MDSGFKFVLYDFSVDKSDAISSGLLQNSSLFVGYLLSFCLKLHGQSISTHHMKSSNISKPTKTIR